MLKSSPTSVTTQPSSAVTAIAPLRLPYLDGIRGLAALYVTLHHAYLQVSWRSGREVPLEIFPFAHWLDCGSFSIAVFILLSGYCLMLPVAQLGKLRGGFFKFIGRRAWRIVPPYYAALALSLLLIRLVPWLRTHSTQTIWDATQPSGDWAMLLSHWLPPRTLQGDWVETMNYPLGTIALEWQIYLLLPLMIIPIGQRFGLRIVLLLAILVGYVPYIGWHSSALWMHPWYPTLFTLGAISAMISLSTRSSWVCLRTRLPWGWLACVLGVGWVIVAASQSRAWLDRYAVVSDTLVGLSLACLLVCCTRCWLKNRTSIQTAALRFLSLPCLVGLGGFSYSLYLTHAPILALVDIPLKTANASPALRLLVGLGLSTPLCLGVAYMFYWLIERHFVWHPNSSRRKPQPVPHREKPTRSDTGHSQ
jgi:peptidoglycan/LPS O-acetylase OafA/YrhL